MARHRPRLIVGVLLLVLTGCDGGDGGNGGGGGANPLTTAPEPVETRLQRALLTLNDLPSGFTTVLPTTDENLPPCGLPARRESTARAEANFTKGSIGPFVSVAAATFPDGKAREVLDRAETALSSCRSYSSKLSNGTDVTYAVTPLAFPKLLDQTFSVRLTTSVGTVPVETDLIVFRRGDVLVLVGNGSPIVDTKLTEALARKQAVKISAAF